MYRVFEALDELVTICEEARGVPMTTSCVVPRGDVLELLDIRERAVRCAILNDSCGNRGAHAGKLVELAFGGRVDVDRPRCAATPGLPRGGSRTGGGVPTGLGCGVGQDLADARDPDLLAVGQDPGEVELLGVCLRADSSDGVDGVGDAASRR